jgi:DNA-binding NarL/FixJ family response regulator
MTAAAIDMKQINVAVVDDDEEIRLNFEDQIRRSQQFQLAGSFGSAEQALAELPQCRPDVVLMDINLPGIDGVECVRQLKAKMPRVQFIMLTVYQDSDRLIGSLTAGASGYLLKRTRPHKLLSAIREVCSGGAPLTPEMARRGVQHFQHTPSPSLPPLTPRENDVLAQLAKGYCYKEIADHLDIGIGTLQGYVSTIYEKLRVHSRTEAVVKYLGR